ncbi:protein D2-like [Teleopsis dalmanni]|uniref:protein D2-like n=1 Tax=Teleopsis dalmanni TaxID=139649 RepID=UPI0018CF7B9E|nr:protein D2-like [Teleopsis dalmanni]XP_037954899.1 protein D2-like [Teleopsis dalmanni]
MPPEYEIHNSFHKFQVIPDVLSYSPDQYLQILYRTGEVVWGGNEIEPTYLKQAPYVNWNTDSNATYSLMMINPDQPNRARPVYREFLHWLIVNIPGNRLDYGNELAEYIGPVPPMNTGLHRIVFLVFKQPCILNFEENFISENNGMDRLSFSSKKFSAKYELNHPIAANFFQTEFDSYVPELEQQLFG